MKTSMRIVCALFVAIATLTFTGPANAQYGANPRESFVLETGVTNESGSFKLDYTAPEEIAESFLLVVVGFDEDDEPVESVLAYVAPAFEGFSWPIVGTNMAPGSDYTIEVRYYDGDPRVQVLGATQLATTGNNSRTILGFGVVLLVVGSALFYGSRVRSSDIA